LSMVALWGLVQAVKQGRTQALEARGGVSSSVVRQVRYCATDFVAKVCCGRLNVCVCVCVVFGTNGVMGLQQLH
jgi:hypothetical protein